MIARFRVLLPFSFALRQGEDLQPHGFEKDHLRITIFPPCRAIIDFAEAEFGLSRSVGEIIESLRPAEPQQPTPGIEVDGAPVVHANLLQIDFRREDFDRRVPGEGSPGTAEAQWDPPIKALLQVTNGFLARYKRITRSPWVKIVDETNTIIRVDYLADTGEELPRIEGLFRRRFLVKWSWRVMSLNASIWQSVQRLPDSFRLNAWETLLLDAEDLLPDIGAALVVAYAALETFVAEALNHLAVRSVNPQGLWAWINNRAVRDKNPSVREQFDVLLACLGGRSLKEDSDLWEALANLREIRNSYVHEGRLILGGRAIGADDASRLVGKVKEIVEWVEELLPEDLRRPEVERITVTVDKRIS